MDVAARVTSKGQITIPRAVREALGLGEGDHVVFRVEGRRALLARTPDLLDLAGAVEVPAELRGSPGTRSAGAPGGPVPQPAVTAFVDTNVLIRHLTGDPPGQAARASRLLSQAGQLLLPDLIVAEVVEVLESFYEVPRPRGPSLCGAIVAFPAVEVADEPAPLRALEVYEVHRLDFADAYLVAEAETSGVNAVASFDKTIERVPTVRRVEP